MHVSIFSASVILALGTLASAAVVTAPNADATAPGDSQGPAPLNFFGSTGSRNQLLFSASNFAGFGGGAKAISAISFRPYPGSAPSGFIGNTVSVSNVIVTLSTTAKTESGANALDANYDNNVGTGATVVYSGPLTLTTTATDAPGGTYKVADYTINLQSLFNYNPSAGNLLLDVKIPTGATVSGTGFGFLTFDGANDAGDGVASVVNLSSGDATTGTVGTDGAITQFTFAVPEPATLSAFGALGAIFARRSRSRRGA